MFVLDSSSSVGQTNFQTMLGFVNDLIDEFDIGPSNVRVGLVKFSSSATLVFDLDDHTTKTSLKSAVAAVSYTGGSTATGKEKINERFLLIPRYPTNPEPLSSLIPKRHLFLQLYCLERESLTTCLYLPNNFRKIPEIK